MNLTTLLPIRGAARAFDCLYSPRSWRARASAIASYAVVSLGLAGTRASGATLPPALAPPAPFPIVTASSVERETVAPGVGRATYRLLTSAGPVVVSVVSVDPREATVRLGAVLANDRVVSRDETTSSMARRTGAVAGINADYFDINGSGAPVGIVVRDGALAHTPSARVALTVERDRTVRFETYRFVGAAASGGTNVPLTAVNEWPPQGGAALLTPAFGPIPSTSTNVAVLELQPLPADPYAPASRSVPASGATAGAGVSPGPAPARGDTVWPR